MSLSGRDGAHKINLIGTISLATLVAALVSILLTILTADALLSKDQSPNARRLRAKGGLPLSRDESEEDQDLLTQLGNCCEGAKSLA